MVNKLQSFGIIYIYIKPYICSLFQQHWKYFVMVVCFYCCLYYISYVMYIWYHNFKKKEMKKIIDAGSSIIMVEISARRREPLHRSALLQKNISTLLLLLGTRLSFNPWNTSAFVIARGSGLQPLITLGARPAINCTWNESLCLGVL